MQDTDYLFASARVRALEKTLLAPDLFVRMSEVRTAGEVLSILAEGGLTVPKMESDLGTALLSAALSAVDGMAPDPSLFAFFRYPFDCNNLKSALKCRARGIDATPLLSPCGSRPADAAVKGAETGDFSLFPRHMAEGAQTAFALFAKTKDPQQIDIALDGACFADMKESAAADPFLTRLVETKIDLLNILTALRLMRRSSTQKETALRRVWLAGGTFSQNEGGAWLQDGVAKMADGLSTSRFAPLFAEGRNKEDCPIEEFERAADNLYMDTAREARFVPFGAPVLAGYLVAREYEVKNLRILFAGKETGLSPEEIRARLRRSYL